MNRFKLSTAQKDRIAATMDSKATPHVLTQIEKAARKYTHTFYDNESAWKTLDSSLNYQPWRKKGKIKKEAMREYLTALVLIHKSATGEWIGRYNSIVEDGTAEGDHVQEKPHPYIVACLAAVHKRYAPRLLQEVLHELKKSEARENARSETQGLHRNTPTE